MTAPRNSYKVDLREFRFLLFEQLDLSSVLGKEPFAAWGKDEVDMVPGETMRFANDHDPLPLLAQIAQRYGDRVSVEYRQREPGAIVIDFSVR